MTPPTTQPQSPGAADPLAPLYASAIRVLTFGFRLAAAILIVGLVVAVARNESIDTSAKDFADIIPAVLDGEANGIVDLAILSMMATPVVTVLIVALGFFRAGDRRFGGLSLIVLAVLAVSISLSLTR